MQKKSRTLETKLNSTTIKILIGSILLTVACLIVGSDRSGLFPPLLVVIAGYLWMFGALIAVFSIGLFYKGNFSSQSDSE